MEKEFLNNSFEEQETIINILYAESVVSFYTSRKITYKRLYKKLGKPNVVYYTGDSITGARWDVPFCEKKKISSVFSRALLIGNVK